MQSSRNQSYVQDYRERGCDFRIKESDFALLSDFRELLSSDMSDMKTKLDGYQLAEMNSFELTIIDNKLKKVFTEHRLTDSKKIPNEGLKRIIDQYDANM